MRAREAPVDDLRQKEATIGGSKGAGTIATSIWADVLGGAAPPVASLVFFSFAVPAVR